MEPYKTRHDGAEPNMRSTTDTHDRRRWNGKDVIMIVTEDRNKRYTSKEKDEWRKQIRKLCKKKHGDAPVFVNLRLHEIDEAAKNVFEDKATRKDLIARIEHEDEKSGFWLASETKK